MIPRTFPSTFALNGQQQMVVHFLTSVDGLEKWADYIPVKLEQGGPENSYSGCIDVVAISELTADTQAWKEYIPVHVDDEATDTWTVNNVGYIPYNFALFAEAAMQLDLTNGADLDYRVTFNRTTNATVTGPDGLIAYAEHNLLTFSESFDNAGWGKVNAIVTANSATAPDGTTTAEKLAETATTAAHLAFQSITLLANTAYAFTVFLKAKERNVVTLVVAAGSANNYAAAAFDLTSVAVTQTNQAGTGWAVSATSITASTSDFYRCELRVTTGTAVGGASCVIAPSNATTYTPDTGGRNVYTGDGTSGIFIWGAQLEQSSTAREYYPTTVKNLLGFTEHFDNAAWGKFNASISATKVDDIYGEPFAQKLVENTVNGEHFLTANTVSYISGTAYTYSCYAKAAERHFFRISFSSAAFPSTERFAYFNLAAGVLGTVAPNVTASITDVGNGWYRCAITRAATSSNTVTAGFLVVCDQDDNTTYTGDGTSGIFIFGAQLSDSASVDPYVYQPVAAPASTAYYGPRFDYDPVTLAPKGLLIEEQRTNLLLRSEEFDNAYWAKLRSVVTSNTFIAPDGSLTADTVTATETNINGAIINRQSTTISGAQQTLSVYVKRGNANFILFNCTSDGNAGGARQWFDIQNVTVGGTNTFGTGFSIASASITPVGNDWYRCIAVYNTTGTIFNININFVADANLQFGSTNGAFAYVWGAQLE